MDAKRILDIPSGHNEYQCLRLVSRAVSEFGHEKIASFSKSVMFTAQIFDQKRVSAGMNHYFGKDNTQLLLNIVHWLWDLINGETSPS